MITTFSTPNSKNSFVIVDQSKAGSSIADKGREVRRAASVSLRIRWVIEG